MTKRERYLARHRRYNLSDKGRERYLRYWWAKGDAIRRERANERWLKFSEDHFGKEWTARMVAFTERMARGEVAFGEAFSLFIN